MDDTDMGIDCIDSLSDPKQDKFEEQFEILDFVLKPSLDYIFKYVFKYNLTRHNMIRFGLIGTGVLGIYLLWSNKSIIINGLLSNENKVQRALGQWNDTDGKDCVKHIWDAVVVGYSHKNGLSDNSIHNINVFMRGKEAVFQSVSSFVDLCKCVSKSTSYVASHWELMRILATCQRFEHPVNMSCDIVQPAWNNIYDLMNNFPENEDDEILSDMAFTFLLVVTRLDARTYPRQPFSDDILNRLHNTCPDTCRQIIPRMNT